MENEFTNLLADVINSITPEELASCQNNAHHSQHGPCTADRRTMIAYDELVKSS